MNNASMTQLLGRDVTAFSDTISYDGEGPQEIHFPAPAEVERMTVTISMRKERWSREKSSMAFPRARVRTWDGKDVMVSGWRGTHRLKRL